VTGPQVKYTRTQNDYKFRNRQRFFAIPNRIVQCTLSHPFSKVCTPNEDDDTTVSGGLVNVFKPIFFFLKGKKVC
jgi:hypothetical protein